MGQITPPTLITEDHDLSGFTCKHDELNSWLQKRGLKNSVSGASKTYVVCPSESMSVIGYYALAAGSIEPQYAPGIIKRNMPSPIPVFVLGRLAVDLKWSGMGVGKGLLKEAVERSILLSKQIGTRALLCHAIDEEAKDFYLKHGFIPSPIAPLTVMLSLKE